MTVGTKSLLVGVHQFALHPLLVALAWWKLYGFPWDPRLWLCFLVHDWGYWGRPNMDGSEGKLHPLLGARIIHWLLYRPGLCESCKRLQGRGHWSRSIACYGPWARFCLLHSREIARRLNTPPSRLCVADKYAVCLYPAWLYLLLAQMSGELREFQETLKVCWECATDARACPRQGCPSEEYCWLTAVRAHFRKWVHVNADRTDLWRKPSW